VGVERSGPAQYAPLRHIRLAIFADTHREGTWDERKREWDQLHPGWCYSEASNFQRDATQAIKRLLEAPFHA
jgi:hypothetical protein